MPSPSTGSGWRTRLRPCREGPLFWAYSQASFMGHAELQGAWPEAEPGPTRWMTGRVKWVNCCVAPLCPGAQAATGWSFG